MKLQEQLIDFILENIEQGLIVLDQQYDVIYLNNVAKKIFGINKEEACSFQLDNELLPNRNIDKVIFQDKMLKIVWQKSCNNEQTFFIGIITDISELICNELKISCLTQIMDNIHEGVVAHDKDGKIFIFNKASEKLEGIPRDEVLGKNILEVYQLNSQSSQHYIVMDTKKPRLGIYEKFFTKQGKEINLVSDNFPIYMDNEIVGVYAVCRNITKVQELLNKTIKLQNQINQACVIKRDSAKYSFGDIIGRSNLIKKSISDAKRAAEGSTSVLITGDTGTGKELFAQSIHNNSRMCDEPFVAINCAAIPVTLLESLLFGTVRGSFTGAIDSTGLIEQAGKGTLFLDELNSMDLSLQAKLLRVLQEKSFRKLGGNKEIPLTCRVISAVNLDPLECIANGALRQDLFYRLAIMNIYIPPLRERKEDIDPLLEHFIEIYNQKYDTNVKSVSPAIMDMFMKYNWPGNVRELQNLIESAINMVENEQVIDLDHMPYYFFNLFAKNKSQQTVKLSNSTLTLPQVLLETEEKLILQALASCKGNITQAALSLGIPRQNLNYKIQKFSIDIEKIRM